MKSLIIETISLKWVRSVMGTSVWFTAHGGITYRYLVLSTLAGKHFCVKISGRTNHGHRDTMVPKQIAFFLIFDKHDKRTI